MGQLFPHLLVVKTQEHGTPTTAPGGEGGGGRGKTKQQREMLRVRYPISNTQEHTKCHGPNKPKPHPRSDHRLKMMISEWRETTTHIFCTPEKYFSARTPPTRGPKKVAYLRPSNVRSPLLRELPRPDPRVLPAPPSSYSLHVSSHTGPNRPPTPS